LQHYQQRFKHILVDEFQDTNTLQFEWLRLLAGHESHLFVVGDDDQSIYSWRGARVEHMTQFSKHFDKPRIIRLEQNYRSTGTILTAANALIAKNNNRLGKNLWTEAPAGDPIWVYDAFNDVDEADFIGSQIETLLQENYAHRQIAVLYRSNAQSRLIEEALMTRTIPYRVYGGLRFFDRAEIKDSLAYLRLVDNRIDDTSFERVINTPQRGIGARSLDRIRLSARQHGCS
jgi:DNA helicase-2/ATP-dependent DNA helicase PcrA